MALKAALKTRRTAATTTPAAVREARRLGRLERAFSAAGFHLNRGYLGQSSYRELRAAVYAVVPGRQKAKNIDDLLDQATTAVCRVIRRRG